MAIPIIDPAAPAFVHRCTNLADPRLGAMALDASDEFFAPKERMLNPAPPVFIPGQYDAHGKWMDGWETRRKRMTGHDWCVIKLARPGVIQGVDIDTSHFTGNYPPAASMEACYEPEGDAGPDTLWEEVVASTTLQGNSHHYLAVQGLGTFTHVRLHIYPDGGVARLRVYGRPRADWQAAEKLDSAVNLAAIENGAYIISANNQHFGLASSLLMPGRGHDMGDGWETRRRREPGNDWCIIALATPGTIQRVEVDTIHFKGNYPDRCSLQAANVRTGTEDSIITQSMFWPLLMPEQKLEMDHLHIFDDSLTPQGPVSHVRFNIIPDGGVSRLRLWGNRE